MKHIALGIAVFLILLISLSFGEQIGIEVLSGLSVLFGWLTEHLHDIQNTVQAYLAGNWGKVVLALLLTLPISYWISRKNKASESSTHKPSRRKIAIFLAVFLGWLGIHRFYIGQLGWGLGYLVVFYVFTPLGLLLGWIDAVRYALMSDDEFALLR